jgi:hypothetical protein
MLVFCPAALLNVDFNSEFLNKMRRRVLHHQQLMRHFNANRMLHNRKAGGATGTRHALGRPPKDGWLWSQGGEDVVLISIQLCRVTFALGGYRERTERTRWRGGKEQAERA